MSMDAISRPGLPAIGVAFLSIGTVAFGGLGAALSLIQREAVEKRGWFTPGDLTDALAFTKPLPGSTIVQVVAFLGWRLGRWPGALVAASAFLTPSIVLMVAAAIVVASLPDAGWVSGSLVGIQVAVVGLLAGAIWKLVRSEAKSRSLLIALSMSFAFGFIVNAALVVVVIGAVGVMWLSRDTSDA
jgi:chromate transporter